MLVRTVIRRTSEFQTVAEWASDCVMNNAGDWLLKIVKRDKITREKGYGAVIVTFGNGLDFLLLLNGADLPKDRKSISRIGVALCIATVKADNDATRLSEHGHINPADSIFEHISASVNSENERDIRLYLHTNLTPFTANNAFRDREKVFRVWSSPIDPYIADRIEQDPNLEVVYKSKPFVSPLHLREVDDDEKRENHSKTTYLSNRSKAEAQLLKSDSDVTKNNERKAVKHLREDHGSLLDEEAAMHHDSSLLGFNPREYILLEKAYSDSLTEKDLKLNASKYTKKDLKYAKELFKTFEDDREVPGLSERISTEEEFEPSSVYDGKTGKVDHGESQEDERNATKSKKTLNSKQNREQKRHLSNDDIKGAGGLKRTKLSGQVEQYRETGQKGSKLGSPTEHQPIGQGLSVVKSSDSAKEGNTSSGQLHSKEGKRGRPKGSKNRPKGNETAISNASW